MKMLIRERASNCQKPLFTNCSVSLKSNGKAPIHRRLTCIHKKNRYTQRIPPRTIPTIIESTCLLFSSFSWWSKGLLHAVNAEKNTTDKIIKTHILYTRGVENMFSNHMVMTSTF